MAAFPHQFILNKDGSLAALRASRYRSISRLAAAIGVHRNSLSNYVNGGPVFPEVLERALLALQIDPTTMITRAVPSVDQSTRIMANLTDRIAREDPLACVVLCGSRARGLVGDINDSLISISVCIVRAVSLLPPLAQYCRA